MGQGQSKTTSGQDAKNDQSQPQTETDNDVGSMPDASSATAPSLGTKLFQMFSKPADNVPAVSQPHSAIYKSPYAPASPFPPSSSTLAQSFRKELTGGSPVQSKQNSSSFFLGKVLISPRRPLREYRSSSSSTCTTVTSPLVTSSVGFHPKCSGKETPNYNLPTPKSLKRKAPSPEYGNRNKSLRLERTASPALKDSFLAGTRGAAQVEEQEEVVVTELLSVPHAEAKNKTDVVDDFEIASPETDNCVCDVNCVDEVDNKVATACDEGVEENDEHPLSDANNFSSHEKLIDESSMTAPYSPSQQPKSLVSVIDISLSSMISCASPGTLLFRRDSTHDDLDMSDAEVNDSNVTNKSLDGTVLQKLKDLKEYFLPASDNNTSQSNNLVINSTQNSSVADNTLLEEPRSLPAAPDDNAVDMNGESRIESMEVCPNEISNSFEASNHGDQQPHSAGGRDTCNRGSSLESVLGLTGGTSSNVSTGYNGNSSAGECSEKSTSSEKRTEEDMDENTLPSAGTTNCSTISNKQWLSVFKMTESKDKCDDGDESSSKRGASEASKASETAHMRPRCSEDAYYHYAPARSTFTSSVSNMKWPYLSISTSSASALGISTVALFKSLPFFDSTSKDDSTSSSQEAEFTEKAKTVAAETSNANTEMLSALRPCKTKICAVPSTNGSVECEIAYAPEEEGCNDDHDDANVVIMIEKENNKSTKTNVGLNLTSSVTDHSGLRTPSEQLTLTPKRSTRIASRQPTTPNSSFRSGSTRNNSAQDSPAVAVSEGTFLSIATPVTVERQRRRRRSPSTDSNASKQSASRSLLDLSPRHQKKRRSGDGRDASLQELTDQASVTHQDETQLLRINDVDVSSNNSLETSKSSHGSTMVDDLTGPSEKSSAPRSKKARTEAALQRNVAVLREENSADYISNSQVLMLVRPTNSGALMRQLRLQFPHASFVSTAAGGLQHKKKKRAGSDSSRQVERSIMEGRSPIIVEAARGVSVVPFLFLAHSANYNTLFYNEDRYLNISPKKNVPPCLPFCYSWFLNLTDSLELARAGKQFLSCLLALPACWQDLAARTHHQGSVAELLSSFIPNNIVGGPEILHCTAKGGASSDPAYSSKPEVMEAVGSTTNLLIVGFVLTPRTFGARVKLTPKQMLVWGNSDEPSVPKEIGQLLADQEDITAEKGALVGSSDAETEESISSPNGNRFEDSPKTVDSPALNQKTKKSIKKVSLDADCDVFCPTSGPGSRAHITLGCFSSNVHPRTTGFDLLKVVEKEQQALKKSADGGTKNRTTVEESDHESDMEAESGSSVIPKASPSSARSESSNADDSLIPMSSCNEEGSSGLASISVGDDSSKGDGVTSSDGIAASVRVEGATVRCYGDGVWVVYPDQVFKVTAMFSGFHNSD